MIKAAEKYSVSGKRTNMPAKKSLQNRKSIASIFKKGISITGAVARSVVGLGATVLLFLAFKKKKSKKG
jgi:hypothetical protein